MKTFITDDGQNKVTRLSRWIKIQHNYNVGKNNSLYEFSTDGSGYKPYQGEYDPSNGTYLDYFRFGGRTYAIEQFIALGSVWCGGEPYMFTDTDGKLTVVGAVDFYGDLYNPLHIEFDEYCEYVRVYDVRRA